MGEVGIGPAKSALIGRRAEKILQVADDLPVHVVDGGGEEKQRADDPAKICPHGGRRRLNRGTHGAIQ